MCLVCAGERAGGTGRVLVIDDEPSVADALRVILEDEGFAVCVAANGRDGIEQARRAPFGVSVIDLRLPDMSGLEIIGLFREGGLGGAFILITSYGTPEILARARDLGVAAVIAKPFLPSEILQLINGAFAGREACGPAGG